MNSIFKIVVCRHCGRANVKQAVLYKNCSMKCVFCDKRTNVNDAKIEGMYKDARVAQQKCMEVNAR